MKNRHFNLFFSLILLIFQLYLGLANLFGGTSDGYIVEWYDNGTYRRSVHAFNGQITSLKVAQNELLVSGGSDNIIRLWNTITLTTLDKLYWHLSSVSALETYKETDGIIRLASGDESGNIAFWNLQSDTFIYAIRQAHNAQISCLRWLGPGTSFLASVSISENLVKIWDLKKFRFLKYLPNGHSVTITSIQVLANGNLVTASVDSTVSVWNIDTTRFQQYESSGPVNEIKQLPNGKLAVLGYQDFSIEIIDLGTEATNRLYSSSVATTFFGAVVTQGSSNSLVSSNGSFLIFSNLSNNYDVTIVSTSPFNLTTLDYSPIANLSSASILPTSTATKKTIVFGGLDQGMVQVWDILSGEVLFILCDPNGGNQVMNLKAIDKSYLAGAFFNNGLGYIVIWSLSSGSQISVLNGHNESIDSMEYLSTGVLMSASAMNFFAWNIFTGTPSTPIVANGIKYIKQINSTTFATSDSNQMINFYDINTYALKTSFGAELDTLMFFSILDNGLLVGSSVDGLLFSLNMSANTFYAGIPNQWQNSFVKRFLQLDDGKLLFCYSRIDENAYDNSATSIELYSFDPHGPSLTLVDTWDSKIDYNCNGLLMTNSSIVFTSNDKIMLAKRSSKLFYAAFTSFGSNINSIEIIEDITLAWNTLPWSYSCPLGTQVSFSSSLFSSTSTSTSTTTASSTPGTKVIAGTTQKSILVYDIASRQFDYLMGHTNVIKAIKLISNDLLLSIGYDGEMIFWNFTTMSIITRIIYQYSGTTSLDTFIGDDGNRQLLITIGDMITVWDISRLNQTKEFQDTDFEAIWCVKWLGPNSGYFATGSNDGMVKIWDTQTFKFVRRLRGHTKLVLTLEVLSDGRLASASFDGKIILWNVNSGEYIKKNISAINQMSFIKQLDDGNLAIAGIGSTLVYWNLTTNFQQTNLNNTGVYSILVDPNNSSVLLTSSSTMFSFVDILTHTLISNIPVNYTMTSVDVYPVVDQTKSANILPYSADSSRYIIAGGMEIGDIQFWDMASGEILFTTCSRHSYGVTALKFIKDVYLASGGNDNTIIIWNLATAWPHLILSGHTSSILSIEYLNISDFLVSSSSSEILFWNATTGAQISRIPTVNLFVKVIKKINEFQFATGESDGTICIYDSRTLALVKCINTHESVTINTLEMLQNGFLASGSDDGLYNVWNITTGANVQNEKIFNGGITQIKQLSDGSIVLASQDTYLVRIDFGLLQQHFWQNNPLESYYPMIVSGKTFMYAQQDTVKLINQTSNSIYLQFNAINSEDIIAALENIDGITLPWSNLASPSVCLPTTPTTTTTTAASSTITMNNSTLSMHGLYTILNHSDVSYLAANLVSSYQLNSFVPCGAMCSRLAMCQAFVFNSINKNCSLYKQLSDSIIINSPDSNIYFKI